jgi:hypothetical protein
MDRIYAQLPHIEGKKPELPAIIKILASSAIDLPTAFPSKGDT